MIECLLTSSPRGSAVRRRETRSSCSPRAAEQFAAFHNTLNDVHRTYDRVSLSHHRPGYAVAFDFLPPNVIQALYVRKGRQAQLRLYWHLVIQT